MCDLDPKTNENFVETIIIKIEPQALEDNEEEENSTDLLENDFPLVKVEKVEFDENVALAPTEAVYLEETSSTVKKELLDCDSCDFKSYDRSLLGSHVVATHKRFLCDFCNYQAPSKLSLGAHSKIHSFYKIKLKQSSGKELVCAECDYKCSYKFQLLRHFRRRHTDEKPYKCNLCPSRFHENFRLKNHMLCHFDEKPFSCDKCEFRCSSSGGLTTHLRYHRLEPLQCNFCEYKNHRKASFDIHMRTHTGEKPFKCELCEYKCACKRSLRIHMRVHTGEKPYNCHLCDSKFAQRCHLKSHMLRHTSDKPVLSCHLCDTKFSMKSSLNRHLRRQHEQKKASLEAVNDNSE